MKAPRLFICRDKNTQGCLPGRLRIFIGQKPTLNERGEWCNYSAVPEDFKVAIPREMYPDIKDGGYMTYDYEYEVDQHEMSDLAAMGPSRLAHHPWHKATVERPETKKDVKLLGWFDTGSTAYDFDIIKFRVRDGEFCDRNGHPMMADKLWWRTLEKPINED